MPKKWFVQRDGKDVKGPLNTKDEAFYQLHQIQSMSADWAMEHEGYSFDHREVPDRKPAEGWDTWVCVDHVTRRLKVDSVDSDGDGGWYVTGLDRDGGRHGAYTGLQGWDDTDPLDQP